MSVPAAGVYNDAAAAGVYKAKDPEGTVELLCEKCKRKKTVDGFRDAFKNTGF